MKSAQRTILVCVYLAKLCTTPVFSCWTSIWRPGDVVRGFAHLMRAFSDLSYRCMACVLVFNKAFLMNCPPDIVLVLGPWEVALGHGYVC